MWKSEVFWTAKYASGGVSPRYAARIDCVVGKPC
jgi:hypothetical protein